MRFEYPTAFHHHHTSSTWDVIRSTRISSQSCTSGRLIRRSAGAVHDLVADRRLTGRRRRFPSGARSGNVLGRSAAAPVTPVGCLPRHRTCLQHPRVTGVAHQDRQLWKKGQATWSMWRGFEITGARPRPICGVWMLTGIPSLPTWRRGSTTSVAGLPIMEGRRLSRRSRARPPNVRARPRRATPMMSAPANGLKRFG